LWRELILEMWGIFVAGVDMPPHYFDLLLEFNFTISTRWPGFFQNILGAYG
jgi:hypothetical protein